MAFQTSTIATSTTTKMPAGYTQKYSASATSVLSSTTDGVVTTSISDVFANKKIEIIWDNVVEEVIGDKEPKSVKSIKIKKQ